jgi:Type I restriction enzyme R protein N terminus (HSDR_N)
MGREYWQVAAGSSGRDYSDRFIRWGMAFVGGKFQMATLDQVALGDVIVLKSGLSRILAVGEVAERDGIHKGNGDKPWLRDFDGWDLPAYCCVNWRVPEMPIETEGLTRATIQRLPQEKHRQIADRMLALPPRAFEPEPAASDEVTDDEILEFLVSEGLRSAAADELTTTIKRIRLLAKYYYNHGENPVLEHEIRTFLVIPLLIALGWAEQQIKIELSCKSGRVDVACFSHAYHEEKRECVLLIETKEFFSGLDYAPEQARRYAEDFLDCQVLVVSNGYCYKTYQRSETEFSDVPSAYLNILRPHKRYPLDPERVDGAFGVLKWLLPGSLR